MINRALIRIRVIQALYAGFQKGEQDVKSVENELMYSLEKSYELYFAYFALLVELRQEYLVRIEQRKKRLLATSEDLNPNLRLARNKVIDIIASSPMFSAMVEEKDISWAEHDTFVKDLLLYILQSDVYQDYISSEDSFENDLSFCRKVFKKVIFEDEDMHQLLEDLSVYWNGDIDIVESFVLKTLKKISPQTEEAALFLPMYKDKEDQEFASRLVRYVYDNQGELKSLIEEQSENWDLDRIALADMIVMQCALGEILVMKEIPLSVTLNEYVELVKKYSTPKSASFVNAVLDSASQKLKKENRISKE